MSRRPRPEIARGASLTIRNGLIPNPQRRRQSVTPPQARLRSVPDGVKVVEGPGGWIHVGRRGRGPIDERRRGYGRG
jgi:hypothetical protein